MTGQWRLQPLPLSSKKAILSVSRLDYTKGIVQSLLAYERFLDDNPQWFGRVILILCVAPSCEQIADYQIEKQEIESTIGRINGKFSTIEWLPVYYQYKQLSFEQICALDLSCDIAFITPIIDGMNLISKECIATRFDFTGSLVLSRQAGSASEFEETLLVNPYDVDEMAKKLKLALNTPILDQISVNQIFHERLRQQDIVAWASGFLKRLEGVKGSQVDSVAD